MRMMRTYLIDAFAEIDDLRNGEARDNKKVRRKSSIMNNKIICSVVVTQEDTGWYVATDVATRLTVPGTNVVNIKRTCVWIARLK